MAEELEPENQEFLEQQRIQAEKEAKTKEELDAWYAERATCDADIEYSKLVKQEEQEFDVGEWLKGFLEERQRVYDVERAKKKFLRKPIVKQRRSVHETYLRNMKRYKKNQLSHFSDDEIEKMF